MGVSFVHAMPTVFFLSIARRETLVVCCWVWNMNSNCIWLSLLAIILIYLGSAALVLLPHTARCWWVISSLVLLVIRAVSLFFRTQDIVSHSRRLYLTDQFIFFFTFLAIKLQFHSTKFQKLIFCIFGSRKKIKVGTSHTKDSCFQSFDVPLSVNSIQS